MTPDISSRVEFDQRLGEAHIKMEKLIQEEGGDPVLKAILRQIEAIETWTAGGQNMTAEQKKRIIMGLQASRQMETWPVERELVLDLYNYIVTKMPTALPSPPS